MIHALSALARPLLLALEPETAHRLVIEALQRLPLPKSGPDDPLLAVEAFGLRFPNPLGMAAGFDKNAEVADAVLRLGFGFTEIGSVTPKPQPGNPPPRLFRFAEDCAVINRFGFNSAGHAYAHRRLAAQRRHGGIVGVNLGSNKEAADRIADFVAGIEAFADVASYFVVNVSSPNTPGLRHLQSKDALDELLGRLAAARSGPAPIFLKVAPDLDGPEIEAIAAAVARHRFEGIVVSNTTLSRPDTLKAPEKGEAGGLSGAPLLNLSTQVLRLFRQAAPRLALIGVGGIASGADAYAKIRAGADAVQLYSALAYEGPDLVRRIKRDLAALLKTDGFASVAEARGRG